jgi:alpha-amylase
MIKKISSLVIIALLICGNSFAQKKKVVTLKKPFVWESANVYFLLTDRFNNGDKTNDLTFNRNKPTAVSYTHLRAHETN